MATKKKTVKSETPLQLASPWITYRRKINAFFEKDPDVTVGECVAATAADPDMDYVITVTCSSYIKSLALREILKQNVSFGNINVKVEVLMDTDKITENFDILSIYEAAFEGNSKLSMVDVKTILAGTQVPFVIFDNELVQFPNDDIGDYYNYYNGINSEVAKEIFEDSFGVHYSNAPVK